MRVLVCGGRDYDRAEIVYEALQRIHAIRPITVVIQGEARGADALGKRWAIDMGIRVDCYPADWNTFGKYAGHLRNRNMLTFGLPDLVLAFPGGRGTNDMVMQALKESVAVIRVWESNGKPSYRSVKRRHED